MMTQVPDTCSVQLPFQVLYASSMGAQWATVWRRCYAVKRGAISVLSCRWWCQPSVVRVRVVVLLCLWRLCVPHRGAPLRVVVVPAARAHGLR